jgi:nucleoside-diphosphate-sugar epimerase
MNSEELILVTGATGFLGVQLVRELLERQPQARLALLIRDRAGKRGSSAPIRLFPQAERSRVQVYSGDVGQPTADWRARAYQRLSAETTRVIHSAATVRFDHSLEEARRINVEGTRRVLDFAAGMRQLRSLAYVGTAYVAGERSDLVRESELAVGRAIATPTNRPKPRRRRWCARGWASLPGVILRPSIIVGDSRTGVTSSFKMMYWPLKIYARRLWRTVPGYPDAVLDIVPVDFVAAAVARLAFDEAALGSTVTSAPGRAAARRSSRLRCGPCGVLHVREPRYVDPKLFFAAVRPLLFLTLWGRKRRVLRDGRAYRDYFTMRMQFDTTNAERLLGPPECARRRCWTTSTASSTTAWPATGAASRSPRNEHLPRVSTRARPQRHGGQSCG